MRTDLGPGDVGRVVLLHGLLYAREHGFDPTFEAYVTGPLAKFALSRSNRERKLTAAARLYRAVGFQRVRRNPGRRWGVRVVEVEYELILRSGGA